MDDRSRLTTFLQSIEPRAWVFLNVQCDDPGRAAAMFRDTIGEFALQAANEPLARWPMCFWTILLSRPGLTMASVDAPEGARGLARVPPGPRAAFLLPMIAGLDEAHATEALGVSSRALAHALVRARTAWPDVDAHEALRAMVQARIREPTDADRKATQALRAEALGNPAVNAVLPEPGRGPISQRRRGWLLWAVLALLALAWLAASTWTVRHSLAPGHNEALPMEALPAPPALVDATIVTHPDYALLAVPEDATVASDLARLAWFDANSNLTAVLASTPDAGPSPEADLSDFDGLPMAERELLASARSTWASLDEPTRERLAEQARDWLHRTPAEREALRKRMSAWDRLDVTERARRRAPFGAWQQLSNVDRQRLRDAARRWSALPVAEQNAAQASFSALPADAQRLWWLGPTLGRELAPIAANFAFLPEDQRDAFLAMLRGLDGDARGNFSQLSERLDAGGRDRLRRDLQAVAPDQRGAWLRARQAQ